jgi:hypothetical protein
MTSNRVAMPDHHSRYSANERRNPIPGNADAIEGEITRYRDLSERCRQAEHQIHRLSLDSWDGPASDLFEVRREQLRQQWAIARIAFRDCADALDRYRQTLITVQHLARLAQLRTPADGHRLEEDIKRWQAQRSEQAEVTAGELQDARRRLLGIDALFGKPLTRTRAEPPAPQPAPPATSGPPATHPPAADPTHRDDRSPRMLRVRIHALCAEVLDADYISADLLRVTTNGHLRADGRS